LPFLTAALVPEFDPDALPPSMTFWASSGVPTAAKIGTFLLSGQAAAA
jgi:hypothetical protein